MVLVDRQRQVFADAGLGQRAIERHVVVRADQDEVGLLPAHLAQLFEFREDFFRRVARLDHQEIGARTGLVLVRRRVDRTVEERRPRLLQAAVAQHLLDRRARAGIEQESVNFGALNDQSPER